MIVRKNTGGNFMNEYNMKDLKKKKDSSLINPIIYKCCKKWCSKVINEDFLLEYIARTYTAGVSETIVQMECIHSKGYDRWAWTLRESMEGEVFLDYHDFDKQGMEIYLSKNLTRSKNPVKKFLKTLKGWV